MESHRLVKELVDDLEASVSEEFARSRAKEAGVNLDKRLRVLDVMDRDRALNELRLPDFYCDILETMIDNVEKFYGYEHALEQARRAPIIIDADGEVKGFYGTGRKAVEILIEQMEEEFGSNVIEMRMSSALRETVDEERYDLLPERIRKEEDKEGLIKRLFG